MGCGRGFHRARVLPSTIRPALRRIRGAFRPASGLSAFSAVFILLIAAVALLLYFRERIQNNVPAPVVVPEEAASGRLPSSAGLVRDHWPSLNIEPGPAVGVAEGAALVAAKEALERDEPALAITILREAIETAGASGQSFALLAASLNAAGLAEFRDGRYESAGVLFAEAMELSSEGAYAKNLAAVKLKLDDAGGAASLLVPFKGDPIVRSVLKDIYIRLGNDAALLGDVESASRNYSNAAALDPEDEALKEALDRYGRQAVVEAEMSTMDGEHFVVKYDGGENAVAGHLIGLLLEEAYAKVGADFGFYPADAVTALLYSREKFRDITRTPEWSGGVYDGRIKLPAGGVYDRTDELARVVYHEYTHAVVHRLSGGRAPVWLSEGLAMYQEGVRSADYAGSLRALAATGKVALAPLEGSFMSLDADGARTAYLLSLSATEHLIGEFGFFSAKKVLENLASGMELDAAIHGALYLSYAEFEKSWIRSIERP